MLGRMMVVIEGTLAEVCTVSGALVLINLGDIGCSIARTGSGTQRSEYRVKLTQCRVSWTFTTSSGSREVPETLA